MKELKRAIYYVDRETNTEYVTIHCAKSIAKGPYMGSSYYNIPNEERVERDKIFDKETLDLKYEPIGFDVFIGNAAKVTEIVDAKRKK